MKKKDLRGDNHRANVSFVGMFCSTRDDSFADSERNICAARAHNSFLFAGH